MSLTRRLILQKARHHPTTKSRALTDCRHTVSGTISLPSRGTFHHSLTVLIRYRSLGSIQAYRVVPADSQQISRARCYSGTVPRKPLMFSSTGLSPSTDRPSQATSTNTTVYHFRPDRRTERRNAPQHRTHNPRRVSHAHGLAILRFRSPLLTESLLFSLPTGTEMFHFPAFPPTPIYSVAGDTTSLVPGFPIRTSSDPRSVDSSPRHNAASHVLHRLPVPRHPPCALKHLQHKTTKVNSRKNSRNCTSTHTKTPHPHKRSGSTPCVLDARNHYPQIKHHTPPPKQGNNNQPPHRGATPTNGGAATYLRFPTSGRRDSGPVVSKPNSVSGNSIRPVFPHQINVCCAPDPHPLQV